MMRLAEVAQAGMGIVLDVIFQRRGQARLADAGLAGQQHHAAFAVLDLLPSPQQQLHFLVAADQRGLGCRAEGLEAARDGALAQHAPSADRVLEALELRRLDGLVFEQIAGEAARGGGDDDGIRRCGRLQPRREVRRFADDVALLRFTGADEFADNHEAGGEADAHLVADAGDDQSRDGVDQRERGAHRIFGVGFARLGIAEIDQHAVAHIFGDIAAEARDYLGGACVVGGDDLAQILRIEPGRSAVEPTRSQNITVSCRRSADEVRAGKPLAARSGGGAPRRGFAKFDAALRAEARARRIGVAASGAVQRLRRAALRAKAAVAGNGVRAARAGFGVAMADHITRGGHSNRPSRAIAIAVSWDQCRKWRSRNVARVTHVVLAMSASCPSYRNSGGRLGSTR